MHIEAPAKDAKEAPATLKEKLLGVGLIAGLVAGVAVASVVNRSMHPPEKPFSFPPLPTYNAQNVPVRDVSPFLVDSEFDELNPCYIETEDALGVALNHPRVENNDQCINAQRNGIVTLVNFEGSARSTRIIAKLAQENLAVAYPGVPLNLHVRVQTPSKKAKRLYDALPGCDVPRKKRTSPATLALKHMNFPDTTFLGALGAKFPCGDAAGVASIQEGFFDVDVRDGSTEIRNAVVTRHEIGHVAFSQGHYGRMTFYKHGKAAGLGDFLDVDKGVHILDLKKMKRHASRAEYDTESGNEMGNPYSGSFAAMNPLQINQALLSTVAIGAETKEVRITPYSPDAHEKIPEVPQKELTAGDVTNQTFVTAIEAVFGSFELGRMKGAMSEDVARLRFNQIAAIPLLDSFLGEGVQRVQIMFKNDRGDIIVLGELTADDQRKKDGTFAEPIAAKWGNASFTFDFSQKAGSVFVASLPR